MKRILLGLIIVIILAGVIMTRTSWFLGTPHNPKHNTDSESKAKIDKKQPVLVSVREYGAAGDGKTDDTKAIQKAIDSLSAKGGTVIFDTGKTYRITDSITSTKNINLISRGEKPAKIYMDNKDKAKPALYFKGRLKYRFVLKSGMTLTKTDRIPILGDSDVEEGDLLLIESNTPWYFDPRIGTEDLHKGELHRVRAVSGSTVWLDNSLWDSYNSGLENITVKVISPIRVNIDNIAITRPKSKNRTIGIKLEYCADSVINKTRVTNSSSVGIHLVSNYGTIVEHSTITGANDRWSGYGIQSYGSSFSIIRNNKILGSRRGVDVSGLYPDHHTLVESNTVYGGGKNELGLTYLSEDTQYGIGTHSTANHTLFRSNLLLNLNYGINIRSANVTIERNRFIGYFKGACIILSFGRNAVIKENEVIDSQNSFENNKYKLPSDIKQYEANTFLYIKRSYSIDNSFIQIENNNVKGVQKEFIKFLDVLGLKNNRVDKLSVRQNSISYKVSDPAEPFYLVNSEFPIMGKESQFINNKVDGISGSYKAFNNFSSAK